MKTRPPPEPSGGGRTDPELYRYIVEETLAGVGLLDTPDQSWTSAWLKAMSTWLAFADGLSAPAAWPAVVRRTARQDLARRLCGRDAGDTTGPQLGKVES